MNRGTDRNYLLNEQYKDASNLSDRGNLHERFSTNPELWMHWLFDRLDLPADAHVLELGCGPAWLWQKNLDRIPEGWDIVLSDLSPGMIEQARDNLRDGGRAFRFERIDAQDIPFEDETFDAVVANHMLYHVPDRDKAFVEIRRVLKSGGRLYAATNGKVHMRDLRNFVERVNPDAYGDWGMLQFSLENGAEQLASHFESVDIVRRKDGLHVTDVDALVTYSASSKRLNKDHLEALRGLFEREMTAEGAVHIRKDVGVFVAQKHG